MTDTVTILSYYELAHTLQSKSVCTAWLPIFLLYSVSIILGSQDVTL